MAKLNISASPMVKPPKMVNLKPPQAPIYSRAPEVADIGLPQKRFRAPKESPVSAAVHWSGK